MYVSAGNVCVSRRVMYMLAGNVFVPTLNSLIEQTFEY